MTPLSKGPAFIVYDKDPDRPVQVEIAAQTGDESAFKTEIEGLHAAVGKVLSNG